MSDTKRIERFLLRNTRDIGYNDTAMFVTGKLASQDKWYNTTQLHNPAPTLISSCEAVVCYTICLGRQVFL